MNSTLRALRRSRRIVGWLKATGPEGQRISFAAVPCGLNLLDPEADS